MTYTKLNNIYDDGFNKYCECCNEYYPVYKVKMYNKSCNLQLNNKMHVRFFDTNTILTIQFRKIRSIELSKDHKSITIYTSNYKNSISFNSKNSKTIFEKLKLTGGWAGYYDCNKLDNNAVIGKHPKYKNLYLASGFTGRGLMQAPGIGRALTELINTGSFQSIDLSALSVNRVLENKKTPEPYVL